MPNESILPDPFPAYLHEFSLRRRARHDPSGAVDGGKKCFARNRRIDSFDNHRVVAHASADKTFLAGERRSRAFPHHPVMLAIVFLAPGEVMMVVHFLERIRTQNPAHDM